MTISSTVRTAGPYTGTGSVSTYPFAFKVFQASDLLAQQTDTSGNITTLVLTTNYSVALNADQNASPGGSIVLNSSLPNGYKLILSSQVAELQGTSITNNGGFYPQVLEDALDYLTILTQQLQTEVSQCMQLPLAVQGVTTTLPAPVAGKMLGWNATGNAIVNLDPSGVGAGSILDVNVAANAAIASSKLQFNYGVTGSIARTVQAKLQDCISVKDFGATGNGTTDDTAAFNAALAYLATALGTGLNGARLKIPAGKYKLSSSLVVNTVSGGWNVIISGDGPAATVLDFTTAPAGSDGIRISGAGNFFGLEDFMIQNAPNHGVFVGYGLTVGGGGFASDGYIRNVTAADNGGNGFNFVNLFMFEMASCLAFNNTGSGIAFNGFHTSCSVTRCWARNNTLQNWTLNGMAYSVFTGCGADNSGTAQGYVLSNMRGVVFNGCGAESNQKDGWLLFTSTASTTGLLPIQQDIHGVVFVSCNAFNNSLAIPGAYGTVATIITANNRNADARWIGGVINPATGSDLAFVLAGNSGAITQYLDGPYYENVATADTATGVVTKINSAVIGLNATVQLASAQSIPNNANTVVTWSPTFASNTLNCTYNGSTNGIVIPVGVNRIRVSCGIDFSSSSNVGVRQLYVRKNGSSLLGLNSSSMNAPTVGDAFMSTVSAIIAVAPGDYITALVYQNSGGALNVNSGTASWLSVEAVG